MISSPVGNYPITFLTNGSDNNYEFNLIPGSLSVGLDNQTITFGVLADKTYGDAPFTLSATVSSELSVEYSSLDTTVAAVSGSTLTIVGAGSVTIRASQPGNESFAAAPPIDQTLMIGKKGLTTKVDNKTKPQGAVNPALTITYSGFAGTDTIDDIDIKPTLQTTAETSSPVGNYPITFLTSGNDNNYELNLEPGNLSVGLNDQSITFGTLANKTFGDAPFTLGATTSSGLAVEYSSLTPAVATVSGSTVTIVGAGTAIIRASQSGNASFAAANPIDQTLTVTQSSQTITFETLANKTFGDAPFSLNAMSSSGLAVEYSSLTPAVATVSGSTVTIVGAGTAIIRASQSGNASFAAANPVDQTLTVARASQTITFETLANKTFGDAPFTLGATASSGLTIEYSSLTPAVATVSGSTVTIISAGTATIRASQPGNESFAAANPVDQSLTVAQSSQTITFGTLADKTFGDAPFTLGATANSGLAVEYSSLTPAVATVSGSILTVVGAGTATIRATQPGNVSFAAATPVEQTLIIKKKTLITIADNKNKTQGAENPELTISYSGFVNGNTVDDIDTKPTLQTTAMTSSPVGNYPIIFLTNGSDNNYDLELNNGTLTVTNIIHDFQLNLLAGWNLIATPINLLNPNIHQTVESSGLLNKINSVAVWYWNNGQFKLASQFDSGNAYWLYSNSDVTLLLRGNEIDSTSQAVIFSNGWNMYGAKSLQVSAKPSGDISSQIWGWDP